MADRYQERTFPSDADDDRGANPAAPARGDSDPLAELARLIGQSDPFSSGAKTPHPLQSRANVRPQHDAVDEEEVSVAAGPPPWMQRARHDAPPLPPQQEYEEPEQDYQPSPVHPLHRYAAQQPAAHEQDHHAPAQQYADEQPVDPSRYDDALYGQLESGQHEYARDPAFPDDPYAYQSDYEEEPEPPRKRSNGLITVAAVLALAVVGTGAAFAYRTYVGSPRSGEPPIIKADNSPTKVMATPGDGAAAKTPDRMVPGDGGEKIVSREEAPVDVNSRSGPRVVFPPLNPNGSPPSVASVSPAAPPPATAANGSLPNNEPRKVKTLAVKGDADNGGVPAGVAQAKPAPAARTAAPAPAPAAAPRNPSSANASANGPLALTPQGGAAPDPAPTRVAATGQAQAAPSGVGYLVQVSSQKNEADALASYRALQGKYPSVLGTRSASIRRADLGDKGVVYRSMVGPFGSQEEAAQLCGNLKTAGGQCVILRN
ncbi:SPOR domain-containing protein [Bradyrhizobium sp. AUGA SZCCT0169]|uniref:SPOR domain-containing protein n=1 Tax=Bradyrhizobium sp. AUGA SZCCT0169 TaxID=2807663 RepID=UPI001BA96B89|nr:SPOR domain-containing protein [Bradyrhizobium sp. AUGA SZCCT0169]MBR1249602.1 SPOR domain-containing protein [Bradyrhizobium sp. AUGA SZCCT0169]